MKVLVFKTIALFCILISTSFAQFDKVTVKLQSGEEVQLSELPWFKFAINISHGPYKDRATTADWLIVAPPQFCPYTNGYRVQWDGPISQHRQSTIDNCSRRMKGVLDGMPSEVASLCECKVILESQTNSNSDKVIWNSLDDNILNSDEFKMRRNLKGPKGEIPIMLSIGGTNSGIYDFKGNKLCVYNGKRTNTSQDGSALTKIERLLRVSDKPIPVACFGSMSGEMDISQISYSTFRSKVIGDITLKFQNGESYVIKPD